MSVESEAFKKAEDEYFRLKGQLAIGRITRQQFEDALKNMMIQDAQGRWWVMGTDSAKWYVNQGGAWVEMQPEPGMTNAPTLPQAAQPVYHPAQPASQPTVPPVYVLPVQTPIQTPAPAPKPRRGCCGTGCWVILGILVLLVLIGAAFYFRLPQQLGLIQSPSARALSDTPDREAAATLKADLSKSGVGTDGMDVYVFPFKDGPGALAYVVLDAQKGFTFKRDSRDPIVDLFKQMASTSAAKQYDIRRFAIEYKGIMGGSVLKLTASTDTITGYANGSLSREQFLKKIDGEANWVAFYQETLFK